MGLSYKSNSPVPEEAAKSSETVVPYNNPSNIRGADGTCHVVAAEDYNTRDSGIPAPVVVPKGYAQFKEEPMLLVDGKPLQIGITPEAQHKLWKRLPWWKRLWALLSFGG